ncbi:MAG: cob(I)yrinic acid a,c-diamide adenosyltransferase [Paludibacter sp.]|nr:cob(I)yrinic acid a,c-diamide adenosyltransferase [Bacteroidales bacterium]MCM1069569.1 cob(I)yrinic acid a,c-diamide adenosyltransferase [Prevotella sp.]MCM1354215.1 cob(I)yrinic acid a,c-diamide adenosyltransferase [Bacteroides sp.]MCM1443046.1 cob(I)yrinic acid a,c-diamide adenosyltransferase [Muribaculum sp.]MCM1482289.1 cob(I)yrinic acid a,c-diamide adenosyltransferase [Paludibacter sp.]
MKIYTKTGDKGKTSLIGGTRVSKAHLRLDTYGTADELNAFVGLLRAKNMPHEMDLVLHNIQNKLFNLGAFLATDTTKVAPQGMALLTEQDVADIEYAIDSFSEGLPAWEGFVLPAGNERVALCHVCRTVTRRLERRMVCFLDNDNEAGYALQYVNRLSDFFFVLARKVAQIDECGVFLWGK